MQTSSLCWCQCEPVGEITRRLHTVAFSGRTVFEW
jgi:hypothetical protein